jgi:hypothetical protein
MRIEPISALGAVQPILPVRSQVKLERTTRVERFSEIRDENLGKFIDFTITGPWNKPRIINHLPGGRRNLEE